MFHPPVLQTVFASGDLISTDFQLFPSEATPRTVAALRLVAFSERRLFSECCLAPDTPRQPARSESLGARSVCLWMLSDPLDKMRFLIHHRTSESSSVRVRCRGVEV